MLKQVSTYIFKGLTRQEFLYLMLRYRKEETNIKKMIEYKKKYLKQISQVKNVDNVDAIKGKN